MNVRCTDNWLLDAAAVIGGNEFAGEKLTSSGYWPPELAAAVLELTGDAKPQIPATKEFDVSAAHFSPTLCDNINDQIVSSEIGAMLKQCRK